MHSFEVHSNESACIKSGCLGLEQVWSIIFPVVNSPFFIPLCAQSMAFCFINLTSGNLLRLKDQMDKMVLSFQYLFLCLLLN